MRKYPGQPNESRRNEHRSYCNSDKMPPRLLPGLSGRCKKVPFRLHNLEATVRQAFVEQVAVLFHRQKSEVRSSTFDTASFIRDVRAVMAGPLEICPHIFTISAIRTRRIDRQIADSLARQRQRLGKRVAADRIGIKFRYIRLLFAVKYDFPLRFIRNQENIMPVLFCFSSETSASFVNVFRRINCAGRIVRCIHQHCRNSRSQHFFKRFRN